MSTPDLTVAARLIAKLLAHRQTPHDEVAGVIQGVHGALSRLGGAAETPPIATAEPPAAGAPGRKRRVLKTAVAAAGESAVDAAIAEPLVPAAMPKLVRRAEVAAPPPVATSPATAAPASQGAVRGVVKWFDPRAGKGALRLPGFSGDVVIEARILAESGIARLFKGQEIEATIEGNHGRTPQVLRIAVPGSATATPIGSGVVHSRRAKPVLVELKREALRRAAARAEAEHVLGSGRPR